VAHPGRRARAMVCVQRSTTPPQRGLRITAATPVLAGNRARTVLTRNHGGGRPPAVRRPGHRPGLLRGISHWTGLGVERCRSADWSRFTGIHDRCLRRLGAFPILLGHSRVQGVITKRQHPLRLLLSNRRGHHRKSYRHLLAHAAGPLGQGPSGAAARGHPGTRRLNMRWRGFT